MPEIARKMLLVKPKVAAPLDPDFAPTILASRAYLAATKDCTDKLHCALIRASGVGRISLPVFPDSSPEAEISVP